MLEERLPALAKSYNEMLKRITHTGTVMVTTTSGGWYHSADESDIKAVRKRIRAILADENIEEEKLFKRLMA